MVSMQRPGRLGLLRASGYPNPIRLPKNRPNPIPKTKSRNRSDSGVQSEFDLGLGHGLVRKVCVASVDILPNWQ